MGESVKDIDPIARLARMTRSIGELAEFMDEAAAMAKKADAAGLAVACLMLRESLLVYSAAIERYVREQVDDLDR